MDPFAPSFGGLRAGRRPLTGYEPFGSQSFGCEPVGYDPRATHSRRQAFAGRGTCTDI
jgi:hypothetical protein